MCGQNVSELFVFSVDNKMLASSEKGVNTGYAVMKIARQIVMDVCKWIRERVSVCVSE